MYIDVVQLPFYELGGAALAQGITKAAELIEKAGELTREAEICDAELRGIQAILPHLEELQANRSLSPAQARKLEELQTAATALQNEASEARTLAIRERQVGEQAQKEISAIQEIRRTGCFVAGTPVWMGDGTTKPIELVKTGDEVLSKDETTGRLQAKQVLHITVHHEILTLRLTFENGGNIETTSEHPLYSQNQGFIKAGDVKIGAFIATRAGRPLHVVKIERNVRVADVYNFTVADFHTYFVGSFNGGIWAHNNDVCDEAAFDFSGNLPGFTTETVPNATYYEDWGLDPHDPEFATKLRTVMEDSKAIHFDLSGLREVGSDKGVLKGPAQWNPKGSTNWELRTIWDNPTLKAKTTFYQDGRILTHEEVEALP